MPNGRWNRAYHDHFFFRYFSLLFIQNAYNSIWIISHRYLWYELFKSFIELPTFSLHRVVLCHRIANLNGTTLLHPQERGPLYKCELKFCIILVVHEQTEPHSAFGGIWETDILVKSGQPSSSGRGLGGAPIQMNVWFLQYSGSFQI